MTAVSSGDEDLKDDGDGDGGAWAVIGNVNDGRDADWEVPDTGVVAGKGLLANVKCGPTGGWPSIIRDVTAPCRSLFPVFSLVSRSRNVRSTFPSGVDNGSVEVDCLWRFRLGDPI